MSMISSFSYLIREFLCSKSAWELVFDKTLLMCAITIIVKLKILPLSSKKKRRLFMLTFSDQHDWIVFSVKFGNGSIDITSCIVIVSEDNLTELWYCCGTIVQWAPIIYLWCGNAKNSSVRWPKCLKCTYLARLLKRGNCISLSYKMITQDL